MEDKHNLANTNIDFKSFYNMPIGATVYINGLKFEVLKNTYTGENDPSKMVRLSIDTGLDDLDKERIYYPIVTTHKWFDLWVAYNAFIWGLLSTKNYEYVCNNKQTDKEIKEDA